MDTVLTHITDNCWDFPLPHLSCKWKTKKPQVFCFLYPREYECYVNRLEPKFEQCKKALYTFCDFRREQCVQSKIQKVERLLLGHEQLFNHEMEKQRKLLDAMWVLAQRHIILTRGGVCVKLYPEIVSKPEEYFITCKFLRKYKELKTSNQQIVNSLERIDLAIKELHIEFAKLDVSVQSPFIVGSPTLQPVAQVFEEINDLYDFYSETYQHLKSWCELLNVNSSDEIQDYQALIGYNTDNGVKLDIYNKDCKCMRTHNIHFHI